MTELSFYEMSETILGVLPPQYEFLYAIGAFILFVCVLLVLFFPALLLLRIGEK